MERHGGELTAVSAPGQGTAITALFPADRLLPPTGTVEDRAPETESADSA